jgi:hypothetical protein
MGPAEVVGVAVDSPNPFKVLRNIFRALRQTKRPNPVGESDVDHSQFTPILGTLESGGLPAVVGMAKDVDDYCQTLSTVDPDALTKSESLAYWINLYNAGAVGLAIEAFGEGHSSVLRIPGGFSRPLVPVGSEVLSLDAIEHGKIRRFGDPRIHGALVCGSLSCPTLRATPYGGERLDDQLDSQMRAFLAGGGASPGPEDVIELSRIFLWYGPDYVRPHRMPVFLPVGKKRVLEAVRPWLPEDLLSRNRVAFQDYEWGLACSVR